MKNKKTTVSEMISFLMKNGVSATQIQDRVSRGMTLEEQCHAAQARLARDEPTKEGGDFI